MSIKLKSKILIRASARKPVKKPVKAKIIKQKKTISGIDLKKIRTEKVEWFDDRFYKMYLPVNVDPSFIENIPSSFIDTSGALGTGEIEVYLPSVSTIKSNSEPRPYLERWRGDVGNERADRISEVALDKGSSIHNAIDLLVNGADVIYQNLKTKNISDKEIKQYQKKRRRPILVIHKQEEMVQVARFQRLINVLNPKILEAEQSVFNLQECYAGTLDQVWDLPGGTYEINSSRKKTKFAQGIYIVDFKTGKGYDEQSTYIQLSAYLQAHHMKEKIVGAIGIHLNNNNKSGLDGVKLYHKTKEELETYFEQFKTYKKIFFFRNPVFPKKFEIPLIITMDKRKGVKK